MTGASSAGEGSALARARRQAAQLRAHDQRGFTLIEMLMVISMLGILAAVVTMAMVGVVNLAQRRAQDEELMTIQAALTVMMMDQQIQPEDACEDAPAGGTNDMSRFPSSRAWAPNAPGQPVRLYDQSHPYLRKQLMSRAYVCVDGGKVMPVGA